MMAMRHPPGFWKNIARRAGERVNAESRVFGGLLQPPQNSFSTAVIGNQSVIGWLGNFSNS